MEDAEALAPDRDGRVKKSVLPPFDPPNGGDAL
jgi:hypothetical protein